MPYIICVNQPGCLPEADPVAVATLDEARAVALAEVEQSYQSIYPALRLEERLTASRTLPDEGGVIGLPGGYVIDVQPIGEGELESICGIDLDEMPDVRTPEGLAEIIEAYNRGGP